MRVYIVNGPPQNGKDTFIDLIKENMKEGYCEKISVVDFVKKVATECGWKGEKGKEDRQFLSDLKRALEKWNDIPFKQVASFYTSFNHTFKYYDMPSDQAALFIIAREPKDIERLSEFFNAKTIYIERKEISFKDFYCDVDEGTELYKYDITIHNEGTLEDLVELALDFIKNEKLKGK